ncbi:MAG: CotH kinase family protein [Rhodospirillales bacterium]|nr:CotH kinase family protein [Rhodospirillales bacterium]
MIEFFSGSKTRTKQHFPPIRRKFLKAALIVIVLIGALSGAFLAGIFVFPNLKAGFNAVTLTTAISWKNKRAVMETLAESIMNAPGYYLEAVLNQAAVPTIRIDIKFKHYEKIRKQRDAALAKGFLNTTGDDFVPARIRYQGRDIRVKLRLKGDLPDHFQTDRWSFRIKTRGDDQIFGMKRFSIQNPLVRRYHREPMYLDHLRREGVLAPRYFFIRVIVNGKDVGLMAVEEHFSKEILESQQRREGVILKFSGDNWWSFKSRHGGRSGPYYDFMVSDIEAYRKNRTNKIPRLKKQRDLSIGLLRGFLEGRLQTSDIFDIELLARYLVINKLWNAEHTMVLDNLRLYFNPVTMLIEPIGFDGVPLLDVREPSAGPPQGIFYERIFDDPIFRKAYFKAAKRIGEDAQSKIFRGWVDKREAGYLKVLHRENPLIPYFLGDVVQRHARTIALFNDDMLSIKDADLSLAIPGVRFPQVIKAYLVSGGGHPVLELRNIMPATLSVIKLSIVEKEGVERPLFTEGSGPNLPLSLPGRAEGKTGLTVRFDLSDIAIQENQKIVVSAQVAGHDGTYRETAIPYSQQEDKPATPQALSTDNTLKAHPFLQWNKPSNVFTALPGDWTVAGDIILPRGAGLILNPGTRLRFQQGAMLLARGPLTFRGTALEPIYLHGLDPVLGWNGIAVLGSGTPSRFSHVLIENLKGVARNGWQLTGGVTFAQSNVDITDTAFSDVEAEDALNIIRSTFTLRRTSFSSTRSDGIDTDFSHGEITDGHFRDIGGDAIDISGTELIVNGAVLERISDKALSIGEGSHAEIKNIRVNGAGTGIASKDGSQTMLDGGKFTDILHAAMMSYMKKPSYGPGALKAENVEFLKVGENAVVQTGSKLSINGNDIQSQDLDIDALYSEGYMKK